MTIEQRLYHWVSSVLAPLNLALVRRRTLDGLVGDLDESRARAAASIDAVASEPPPPPPLPGLPVPSDPARLARQDLELLLRHQIACKWSVVDQLARAQPPLALRRQCPLCGFEDQVGAFGMRESFCIFGGGVLVRHECPNCDLVFGPDKMLGMSAAELSQDYEWHYQVYQEGDSTARELRSFHALQPARDGVYLNYGAGGWSSSVQQLREQGWQVFAYEPHAAAAVGGAAVALLDKAALSGLRFDGIYSNNVLEHLRHPVEDLRRLKALLKPGARMAHTTPCFEYLYEYTRFHLFFYPGRSRQRLFAQAGLIETHHIKDDHFMCSILESSAS